MTIWLKSFSLIFFILVAQIFVINFLPFPFDHINVIILSLLWLIILSNKPATIWLILLLSWLTELFSATPFGVDLIALMATLLITSWLLTHVLTNRSIYLAFLLALLGLVIYRSIFFILLICLNFLKPSFVLNKEIIIAVTWEIILTGAASCVLYLFGYKLIKKIDPSYLAIKKKNAYG